MEHGLLVENLLDLAHAPFTHTSTFARGWPIPDAVKFHAARLLGGRWDPYPINMSFEPPCMTLSHIGLSRPGKVAAGLTAEACPTHLHQLHVCLPSRPGHTRLLYRMSMDFMGWVRFVPGVQRFWRYIASQVRVGWGGVVGALGGGWRGPWGCARPSLDPPSLCYRPPARPLAPPHPPASHTHQVLGEDLVLVEGQQDRMLRGADTWANPVAYDKMGVRYRRWRNSLAAGGGGGGLPRGALAMSAGELFALEAEEGEVLVEEEEMLEEEQEDEFDRIDEPERAAAL